MKARIYPQGNADLRVLVVDDDDGLKLLMSKMIKSGGYQVVSANNGADALMICRSADPPIDLLVTDYKMPGMTGLDLARECSRANGDLSVLYVSGSPAGEELRANLAARRRGFLAKPFRKDELLGKVEDLLEMEPDAAAGRAREGAGTCGRDGEWDLTLSDTESGGTHELANWVF